MTKLKQSGGITKYRESKSWKLSFRVIPAMVSVKCLTYSTECMSFVKINTFFVVHSVYAFNISNKQ